jgi:hypothetical protein
MTDLICPFSATLARSDFACARATQVIRRGGAEYACQSDTAHSRCRQLFEHCKQAALPEFGVEDDLTRMPQSVLVKIQFGGLLGLLAVNQLTGTVSKTSIAWLLPPSTIAPLWSRFLTINWSTISLHGSCHADAVPRR